MKRDYMGIKGLKWGRALTAFVFVAAIISGPFMHMQTTYAAGGIATWTGLAGDNKFSTAGNWEDDTLPVNGDILVFNQPATASVTLDNDLDLLYGGVTTGTTGIYDEYSYRLTNDFRLAPGATLESLGQIYLMYESGAPGQYVATGDLTISGPYIKTSNWNNIAPQITYGGQVTVQNYGSAYASTGMTSVTLDNGTLRTGPSTDTDIVVTSTSGSIIDPYTTDSNVLLSGDVTLNSNLGIAVGAGQTVELTGQITDNGHSITNTTGQGTLIVPDQASQNPAKTVSYDDAQPALNETVDTNEIATLSGTRHTITVSPTGVLKGTGTATNITALSGSTVAPGNSPGTITVTNVFDLYGNYQAEILNKTTYDKVIAGEGATPGTITVLLRPGSSLETLLYAGWSVTAGDQFTIIDNRGDQPVSGTFDNLAEGQQLTIGGITFNITYAGGDGNDVVLTALTTGSAPAVGNTGVHLALANPIVIATLGVIAAAAVLLVTRRNATNR